MAASDPDFYLDLSKFHATMVTIRGSFMLVFQSLLLASLAILFGKSGLSSTILTLLMWFGLITACVWAYMNYLTRIVEVEAWSSLVNCDSRVKSLADHRKSRSLGSTLG